MARAEPLTYPQDEPLVHRTVDSPGVMSRRLEWPASPFCALSLRKDIGRFALPTNDERLARLDELRLQAREGGGVERVGKQHAMGKLTARERLELLLDA